MPRKAKVSGAHANRSDLDTQPATAPTGQPYGDRKASMAAQAAVPLPDNAGRFSAAIAAAMATEAPGPGLGADDDRPELPVTSGVDTGPGAGSEVLSPLAPRVDTAAILRSLADATGEVDYELLAQRAEAAGA